jgi:hypothetical protein
MGTAMASPEGEFFGAPPQQEMQRTASALWPLLRDDPRYVYEGRFVGHDAPRGEDVDRIAALVGTQGGSACFFVDAAREAAIVADLRARGFTADRWDHLMADERGVAVSREVIGAFRLPAGFTLHEVGRETPARDVAAIAAMALACGVLLPAGKALRGVTRDSVFFVITNAAGEPVSCSGGVVRHHAASPFADSCWWGMLATREDTRGQGFSVYLGALAMAAMADRFGKRRFYTGVRTENAVSQKICRRFGLTDHGLAVLAALDPARFGDVKMTR